MKNFTGRTFSEKIKARIRASWLVLILMLVYMVIVGEVGGASHQMISLADNVSRIIFFGGLGYVICLIAYNKKLLKNKNLLFAQSVKETDERHQLLHVKSGGIVVDILLLILFFVTCTTALFNVSAFYISLVLLITTIILKGGSYVIYSKIY